MTFQSGVLLGTGFIVGTLVTAFLLHSPGNSGEWASWVQAFGAIIGIGIAIYVPWNQQREQIGERRRAELVRRLSMARRLKAVVDELALAAMHLRQDVQTFGAVGGAHGFSYDLSSLSVLADAARRIEEQDVEFDAGPLTLSIRTQVTEMKRKVESHFGRGHHALDPDFLPEAEKWFAKAEAFQATAAGIVQSAEGALSL